MSIDMQPPVVGLVINAPFSTLSSVPIRLPYWHAYEDGAWELAIRVSACADNCYCSCSIDGFVVMRSSLQEYLTPLHAAPCIRRGTRHNLYHAAGGGVAHSLRISG
jgi:hypothetical protein